MWAGFSFTLNDDDKEEEEVEEEEDKEVMKEEDEEEVQGTYDDGKIFHFSLCFVCFYHGLVLISAYSVKTFHSK